MLESWLLGNLKVLEKNLVKKGQDKLLTGKVREALGQSHSSMMNQGRKYVSEGMRSINIYRGYSSVVGSLIGFPINVGYSSFKSSILGW